MARCRWSTGGAKSPLRWPTSRRSLLVIADENPHGDAWPDVLTGDGTDIAMRAEHTPLLREPPVGTLAEKLRPHLPLD